MQMFVLYVHFSSTSTYIQVCTYVSQLLFQLYPRGYSFQLPTRTFWLGWDKKVGLSF